MTTATYTNKCLNCSASLIYNPESKLFECEYCLSSFTQDELANAHKTVNDSLKTVEPFVQEVKSIDESSEFATKVELYHCDSCGAEVMTDDTLAATTCVFCHNPVVLKGRVGGAFQPDKIIPFKIGKDEAQNKLNQWIKQHKFADTSFVEEAAENLRGVYIPFWVSNGKAEATLDTNAYKKQSIRIGDFINVTSKTYQVHRSTEVEFKDVVFKALDKKTMDLVLGVYPFTIDDAKPFSMDYISGYFAEKRNIEQDAFSKESDTAVTESIRSRFNGQLSQFSSHQPNAIKMVKGDVTWTYTLLPVWFFTYDFNKDPYYYVINGQTGKAAGRIPVNKKTLTRHTLLVFAAVTAVCFLIGSLL